MSATSPLHDSSPPDVLDPGFETIAARLEEAVVVVGPDRRIQLANPAARELLRVGTDCAGARLEEAVADYRLGLMVAACLAAGEEIDRELREPAEDRHVVARAVPMRNSDGSLSGQVVLVLRDESRLRRLETVRSDFVANVSHELRTPLAAIQLLVETLQEGALEDPEVASEFVHKIGLEVGHLNQMVSELLELSRMESGQRAVRSVPVSIDSLLAAAARLQPLADQRGLRIIHDIAPGTPSVAGDPRALAQVMRNLVHNAIKFTPSGGLITIAARARRDDEQTVELRVADTGVGIPSGELQRIFERFYKADKSRQRDGEGTGLGLAIARHTVEACGGRISAESVAGQGSVFLVELPAALMDAEGHRRPTVH
jgi:two-component system phosphate regulon sensor histidine kinase PhoR